MNQNSPRRGAQRADQPIPQLDALRLQLAAIAGPRPAGTFLEIRHKQTGGPMRRFFHPADRPGGLVDRILMLGRRADVYVGAAPRTREHGGRSAIDAVWAVWADLDAPEAVERLAGFRPWPSLVIRSGTGENVHAYWPVREPVTADEAEHANRRIAVHLGADVRSTDAARILRAAGTLNHKHDPPRPVECVRLEIAGQLPTVADVLADVPELPAEPKRTPDPLTGLRARRASTPSAFGDPLLKIAATEYVPLLTGRPLGRDGKTVCPFHGGGQERTPSFHAYPGDGGWACFGSCPAPPGCRHLGGDMIAFGAALYGLAPRGAGYHEIRRRLAADLLREAVA